MFAVVTSIENCMYWKRRTLRRKSFFIRRRSVPFKTFLSVFHGIPYKLSTECYNSLAMIHSDWNFPLVSRMRERERERARNRRRDTEYNSAAIVVRKKIPRTFNKYQNPADSSLKIKSYLKTKLFPRPLFVAMFPSINNKRNRMYFVNGILTRLLLSWLRI